MALTLLSVLQGLFPIEELVSGPQDKVPTAPDGDVLRSGVALQELSPTRGG